MKLLVRGSCLFLSHSYRCQTDEGGFAGFPGQEAHGGYSFCGLAALVILNKPELCDLPRLLVSEWLQHLVTPLQFDEVVLCQHISTLSVLYCYNIASHSVCFCLSLSMFVCVCVCVSLSLSLSLSLIYLIWAVESLLNVCMYVDIMT